MEDRELAKIFRDSAELRAIDGGSNGIETEVSIEGGNVTLDGTLALPKQTTAVVLFAHGSGSSRHSPRNRYVARVLQSQGIGTLLFDLLTRRRASIQYPFSG